MHQTLAITLPSLAPLDGARDVVVHVTFTPSAPVAQTAVEIEPPPSGDGALVDLLDATIARLIVYRDGYHRAATADGQPLRLPVPWHIAGRVGAQEEA